MPSRVSVLSDAATFLDEAGDWLREREAENCLAIGVPATVRAMPEAFGAIPPWHAIARGDRGNIAVCAFRHRRGGLTSPRSATQSSCWA